MLQALTIHPDSRCDAVARFAVEAVRTRPGVLRLRYEVAGRIGDLNLPGVRPSERVRELWRRTCFEAFVRAGPGPAYAEFNFAPSTEWAAYRFNGYRDGMAEARDIAAPVIDMRRTSDSLMLQAELDLSPAAVISADAPWRLGLSAVIEERNGRLSYWALKHPPGKPDFHHGDCFTLELAAPSSP